MAGRPEGETGDFPEPYNADAWQEFTPWRPGDPSPTDDLPAATAIDSGYVGRGHPRDQRETPSTTQPHARRSSTPPAEPDAGRKGRWWTEDVPPTYTPGDRVTSTSTARGILFDHVQAGTKGVVDKVEKSVLGEDRITVRYSNGYTETVKRGDIAPRSWWD